MKIIPAIDIIEGKCVRLTQGDYAQKKLYSEDPLEFALRFEGAGLQKLHLVDLDGAREGRIINYKVIEKICRKTSLKVDVGGGIASDQDLHVVRECGVSQVNIGSLAVKDKGRFLDWVAQYGAAFVILSADVRDEKVQIRGWQEKSEEYIYEFLARYKEAGVVEVTVTDIARDGMLAGPAVDLYKKILTEVPGLTLNASGGVSSLKDLEQLAELSLAGVIVGKAFYEGNISLAELAQFNQQ